MPNKHTILRTIICAIGTATTCFLVTNLLLVPGVTHADTPANVCMIPFSKNNPRSEETVRLATKRAKALGANLILKNEVYQSLTDQHNAFKLLNTENCDAIIIEPRGIDPSAAEFAQSIKDAVAEEKTVISVLNDIHGASFTNRVVMDPVMIGEKLAAGTCSRVNAGDTVYHVFPRYKDSYIEKKEHVLLDAFKYQITKLCPKVTLVAIEADYPRDVIPKVQSLLDSTVKPALIVTDHPTATSRIYRYLTSHHHGTLNNIQLFGFGSNPLLAQAIRDGDIEALLIGDHHFFTDQAMLAAVLGKRGINISNTLRVPILEMNKDNIATHKAFWAQ